MTQFLLIRHGATDALGHRLCGREPGVHLNDAGRGQAEQLAERLAGMPIAALYCGPLERARETAEPLGRRLGLTTRVAPGFDEVDFGGWTGRTFAELGAQPHWRRFNTFRSHTAPPGGELMIEVQVRAIRQLHGIRDRRPGELVAVVSHADVIKATLAHCLGVHLDLFQRIEISPASVSRVGLSDDDARVWLVNAALGETDPIAGS